MDEWACWLVLLRVSVAPIPWYNALRNDGFGKYQREYEHQQQQQQQQQRTRAVSFCGLKYVFVNSDAAFFGEVAAVVSPPANIVSLI